MKFKIKYFVIGAQKAGTTKLWSLLGENNSITTSRVKEDFSFIKHSFPSNAQEYTTDKPQKFLFCPEYAINKAALINIFSYNPDAEIILMTRDPISRLKSNFRMQKRQGETNNKDINDILLYCLRQKHTIESFYKNENVLPYDSLLLRGNYCEIINVCKRIGFKKVHIFKQETLENEPDLFISNFYTKLSLAQFNHKTLKAKVFVGGDGTYLPTLEQINSFPLVVLIKSFLPKKTLKFLFPRKLRFLYRRANVRKYKSNVEIDEKLHAQLLRYYADEYKNIY